MSACGLRQQRTVSKHNWARSVNVDRHKKTHTNNHWETGLYGDDNITSKCISIANSCKPASDSSSATFACRNHKEWSNNGMTCKLGWALHQGTAWQQHNQIMHIYRCFCAVLSVLYQVDFPIISSTEIAFDNPIRTWIGLWNIFRFCTTHFCTKQGPCVHRYFATISRAVYYSHVIELYCSLWMRHESAWNILER